MIPLENNIFYLTWEQRKCSTTLNKIFDRNQTSFNVMVIQNFTRHGGNDVVDANVSWWESNWGVLRLKKILSTGQTESQVWKLALTCYSVCTWLARTCDGLRKLAFTLIELIFAHRWTQVFYRLATQRKSMQVGLSIVFLCKGARARLH